MLDFQNFYDWDYMKVHPRYSYHLEDWGSAYSQSGKAGDWPECVDYTVKNIGDWEKLNVLKLREGVLGQILKAVFEIIKGLGNKVPFIMTIFSPLMIANHLCGFIQGTHDLERYMREAPDKLDKGMEIITETFVLFAEELKKIGVDGLFFATKETSDDFTSAEEYQKVAGKYDRRILETVEDLPFTMLHLCGDKIHFESMTKYPITMVHWDSSTGNNPSYAEGRRILGDHLAIGGGPNRHFMAAAEPEVLKKKIKKVMLETEGKHFLLGPACSVLIAETAEEKVWLLRNAPEQYMEY
ncbi:MAG TPA: hypothetical protein DIC53_04070 [Synergistaceae bacterium]|jgi:uroporphyrinogen decarboxylase|nr:hypothetical protein [Synergistaceae bacterium]